MFIYEAQEVSMKYGLITLYQFLNSPLSPESRDGSRTALAK